MKKIINWFISLFENKEFNKQAQDYMDDCICHLGKGYKCKSCSDKVAEERDFY